MKHILLISQYFYPEPFRVNDMAAEWVKRGYKVTVLTGIPNYPMGKLSLHAQYPILLMSPCCECHLPLWKGCEPREQVFIHTGPGVVP